MITTNISFDGEFFRGYAFNGEGFHNGPSEPFADSNAMLKWIGEHIEKYPELKVTDGGDCLVFHIRNRIVVFPTRDDGQRLGWNSATQSLQPTTARFLCCIQCKLAFTNDNVKTAAGWRETQISGYCETCFDKIFADED